MFLYLRWCFFSPNRFICLRGSLLLYSSFQNCRWTSKYGFFSIHLSAVYNTESRPWFFSLSWLYSEECHLMTVPSHIIIFGEWPFYNFEIVKKHSYMPIKKQTGEKIFQSYPTPLFFPFYCFSFFLIFWQYHFVFSS